MSATNVRIYRRIESSLNSLLSTQVGIESSEDANLGFKMFGYKDADGTVRRCLAKGLPIETSRIQPTGDSSTALKITKADGSTAVVTFDTSSSIMTVAGTVVSSAFRMTTGAAAGYALISDGSGNASWSKTTPTNITGMLKGNGSAISAAQDGTDYLSPSTGALATHYHSSLMASDTDPNPCLSADVSGKIGILTETPQEYLDVAKSQNARTAAQVYNSNTGTSASAALILKQANPDVATAQFVIQKYGTNSAVTDAGSALSKAVYFYVGGESANFIFNPRAGTVIFEGYTGGAAIETMRISPTGTVGIGTSDPTAIGPTITTLDIRSHDSGANDGGGLRLGTSTTSQATIYTAGTTLISASVGPTDVYTNSVLRMRLTADGLTGIGTDTPISKLHLHGAVTTAVYFRITNTTATTGVILGLDDDENSILLNTQNTALTISTNNTERMRITAAGLCGLRTTAPAALFHINGPSADTNAHLYLSHADAAHGMTSILPTTVFGGIKKNDYYGMQIIGISDDTCPGSPGIELLGLHADTYVTYAPVTVRAGSKSGTNGANISAEFFAFEVQNFDKSSLFKVYGNGNAIAAGLIQGATGHIGGEAHYSAFEADGSLTMYGDATVWDDVQFPVLTGKVPASNAPTFENFGTNHSQYSFDVNDYMDLSGNEPWHGWKEGTPFYLHLHAATKAANTSGENKYVKFTVYYSFADVNGVYSESSITAEFVLPHGTAAYKHLLLDIGSIVMTGIHVGSQIVLRVKRIAATTGNEYPGRIFLTQAGIHLEQNRIGSRAIATA